MFYSIVVIVLFFSFVIILIIEELKYHFENAGSYLVEQSIFRIIEIILMSAFLFIFRNSPSIIKKAYQNQSSDTRATISFSKVNEWKIIIYLYFLYFFKKKNNFIIFFTIKIIHKYLTNKNKKFFKDIEKAI